MSAHTCPGIAAVVAIALALIPATGAATVPDEIATTLTEKAESGDEGALKRLTRLAERGSMVAQYNLGVIYLEGRGAPRDAAQAFRWFREAAERDHDGAQFELGKCYLRGRGVVPDLKQAVAWLTRSAEQGNDGAQNSLGNLYIAGQGVARDERRAADLYRAAAEQGHAEAQYNLGALYSKGAGVPADALAAWFLFDLAATRGYEPATQARDRARAHIAPQDIKKAHGMVGDWEPGGPMPRGGGVIK